MSVVRFPGSVFPCTLKLKALVFCERSINTYQNTWRHSHRRENVRPQFSGKSAFRASRVEMWKSVRRRSRLIGTIIECSVIRYFRVPLYRVSLCLSWVCCGVCWHSRSLYCCLRAQYPIALFRTCSKYIITVYRGRLPITLSWFCNSRSQWPRCRRHELPSPARTLESWVRIPLKAWMFVCVYSVFV
jgi:hypothetical protein